MVAAWSRCAETEAGPADGRIGVVRGRTSDAAGSRWHPATGQGTIWSSVRPSSSTAEQWTFNPLVQGSNPWGATSAFPPKIARFIGISTAHRARGARARRTRFDNQSPSS